MSKFTSILDHITEKLNKAENMHEITEIFDGMMLSLEKTNPDLYKQTMHELEEIAYEITAPEAEKIVKAMKPHGQKWDYQVVNQFLQQKGITEKTLHYYLVLNMMYNDYHKTAESIGKQEDTEFYFSLSKDFIVDQDAKPFKVEKYFVG